MSISDALRLILLSAIWGASFLFLRIAAPEFSITETTPDGGERQLAPIPLILIRVGGAALVLLPILLRPLNRPVLRKHWRALLVLGFFNAALPFSLFGFAALHLEAGFTSLLNASTPIFTALVGFLWLRIPLLRPQVLGLVLGVAGIAILAEVRPAGTTWAMIAVLAATCSYGVAGHYAKRRFADVSPLVVSAGSLLFGGLLLAPLAIPFWPADPPGAGAIASAIVLAVVCTAFAFVLFFDLLSRTGATAAATVTFVIPIFGVLWGALFLGEAISPRMLTGMAVALFGTALVTRLLPRPRPKIA